MPLRLLAGTLALLELAAILARSIGGGAGLFAQRDLQGSVANWGWLFNCTIYLRMNS